MRRVLAIVLLALLPLQFSWAAVASYCGHETEGAAMHLGHHEHPYHADADALAELTADASAGTDAGGEKAPGAMDPDCGHCHGYCGAMLTLPAALPGGPGTVPPSATVDDAGAAHAPTRPERPQWLPLA